jgi:hypothetical protein
LVDGRAVAEKDPVGRRLDLLGDVCLDDVDVRREDDAELLLSEYPES